MMKKYLTKIVVVCALLGVSHQSCAVFEGLWASLEDAARRTAEDAERLARWADAHSQMSTAYHAYKDAAVHDVRENGKTAPTVLSVGVGVFSLVTLTRGKGVAQRAVGAVLSGCAALATYVTAPAFCKEYPGFAAHCYPQVAAPWVARKGLEGWMRGYCWARGVNKIASGATWLNSSTADKHHADTQNFLRSVCGW